MIEYTFAWQPGVQEVHPALDKCVFYLTKDKVRIHWLTDGKYDRTGLEPTNKYDEPDHQLVDKLPLKEGDNTLRLELKGDTATIVLNGTAVFRRPMEPNNQRLFGLFHYKGETASTVSSIDWKESTWRNTLPPATEQPFGADSLKSLLASVSDLKAETVCDFTQASLQKMGVRPFDGKYCQPAVDGLQLTCPPNENWSPKGVLLTTGLKGDFDITMDFAHLQMPTPEKNAAWIRLHLSAEPNSLGLWGGIRMETDGQAMLTMDRTVVFDDKSKSYQAHKSAFPKTPTSGRLRYIRKGAECWVLYAAEDSEDYQILESLIIGSGDVSPGRIQVNVLSSGPKAATTATLKRITIKAEELL